MQYTVKTTIILQYVKLNVSEGIKYTFHNMTLHLEHYSFFFRLMLKYKEIYHHITTELNNHKICSHNPHYNILS